jgi:hypothetical protein
MGSSRARKLFSESSRRRRVWARCNSRELQQTRSGRRRCRGLSRIDTCELQRTLGELSAAPGIVKKIPGTSTDAKEASTVPDLSRVKMLRDVMGGATFRMT